MSLLVATFMFFIGMLAGFGGAASAADVYGDWKHYGPHGGYDYKNRSYMKDLFDQGRSIVKAKNNASPPAGWMGVKARVFKSNGVLCNARDWSYNSSNRTVSIDTPASADCGSGNYYSKGKTRAWRPNFNDYKTYSCYRSPNLGV